MRKLLGTAGTVLTKILGGLGGALAMSQAAGENELIASLLAYLFAAQLTATGYDIHSDIQQGKSLDEILATIQKLTAASLLRGDEEQQRDADLQLQATKILAGPDLAADEIAKLEQLNLSDLEPTDIRRGQLALYRFLAARFDRSEVQSTRIEQRLDELQSVIEATFASEPQRADEFLTVVYSRLDDLAKVIDFTAAERQSLSDSVVRILEQSSEIRDLLRRQADVLTAIQTQLHRDRITVEIPGFYRPLETRPRFCFGRDDLIRDVVGALTSDPVRPVCILGHPGIGKSTIAKRALHETAVADRFGPRRFFIRCDAVFSAASLAGDLAKHLGLPVSAESDAAVLRDLQRTPAILVLDNFETPWRSAETAQVERYLTALSSIPGVGICVTLRGPTMPDGPEWVNAVQPKPLPISEAKEAFVAHAGDFEDDPDLEPLLNAMDGVPLAIFLLACAARGSNNLQRLRRRWNEERTKLLQRPEAKNVSDVAARRELDIEACYEVSLLMGGVDENDGAKKILASLAILPDGARESTLGQLCGKGTDAAIDHLTRLGLLFLDDDRVRMLAPLREYAERRFSKQRATREKTMRHYLELARDNGNKVGGSEGEAALKILLPEAGNIEAILLRVLSDGGDDDA